MEVVFAQRIEAQSLWGCYDICYRHWYQGRKIGERGWSRTSNLL